MLRRSVGIASLAGRALKTTNVVRTNFVEYNVILKRSMGGGAMPYNEPGGNLFNEVVSKSKPNRHRTWESWEYGYWSTCIAGKYTKYCTYNYISPYHFHHLTHSLRI